MLKLMALMKFEYLLSFENRSNECGFPISEKAHIILPKYLTAIPPQIIKLHISYTYYFNKA